jgi:hypothetical protein
MERAPCNAKWFKRFVWLGILVNAFLFLPAIFASDVLAAAFNLDVGLSAWWVRGFGLLLLLLAIFYGWVARDPLLQRKHVRCAVPVRFLQAIVWLVIACCLKAFTPWCWLFLIDFFLVVIQLYFLERALANAPVPAERPWRRPWTSRLYSAVFRLIDYFIPWHRLPTYLATLNLGALREDLREHNLHDTPEPPPDKQPEWNPEFRDNRSPEGTYNDLSEPMMGEAGSRFGRNMPLEKVFPDPLPMMLQPNPRLISEKLLARDTFKPATTLNLLAAAWIQFQNHGWFAHDKASLVKDNPKFDANPIQVPIPEGSEWHQAPMVIQHTISDPTRPSGAPYPPTYRNTESQWWDASQVYGSKLELQMNLRAKSEGKMKLDPDTGLLFLDTELAKDGVQPGVELTGFNDNWWMGLSMLHNLFVREHNAICDALIRAYPEKRDDDQWLFQKARLANSALMAKIHTVEWTPGILGHPALDIAMHANWSGILGEWIFRHWGRFLENDGVSGIRGSDTDHHAAPFAFTEEFAAVYRLHPLIPDEFEYRSLSDPKRRETVSFEQIQGTFTRGAMTQPGFAMIDLFYAFGRTHPGAITLRNFPNNLRRLLRLDGTIIDLATIDIVRDRERGVPKYNEFRRNLRMPAPMTFEEMTGRSSDDDLVRTLKDVYQNDIERVDLMVGMFAEPLPKGFGFSDTAFRIFILMASRRLKSDRFYTVDYRPEIYTQAGLDWIADSSMKTVILRHFPDLAPALDGVENAFAPWKEV